MSAPLSFCLPCGSNCPILIPNSIPFFDGAFARACSCNCVLAQASALTSLQCIMPTLCLDSAALGICLPVAVLFQIWATPGCIRNVKHAGLSGPCRAAGLLGRQSGLSEFGHLPLLPQYSPKPAQLPLNCEQKVERSILPLPWCLRRSRSCARMQVSFSHIAHHAPSHALRGGHIMSRKIVFDSLMPCDLARASVRPLLVHFRCSIPVCIKKQQ